MRGMFQRLSAGLNNPMVRFAMNVASSAMPQAAVVRYATAAIDALMDTQASNQRLQRVNVIFEGYVARGEVPPQSAFDSAFESIKESHSVTQGVYQELLADGSVIEHQPPPEPKMLAAPQVAGAHQPTAPNSGGS